MDGQTKRMTCLEWIGAVAVVGALLVLLSAIEPGPGQGGWQEPSETPPAAPTTTETAPPTETATTTPTPTENAADATVTALAGTVLAVQATGTLIAWELQHVSWERALCFQEFEFCVNARMTEEPALESARTELTAAADRLATSEADAAWWHALSWQCIDEQATASALATARPCVMWSRAWLPAALRGW